MIKIAPSILSADFSKLGEDVREVENAGADLIHVDVMDGHFVPNITFGPLVVQSIRPHTALPLDVHLMIEKPERYVEEFAKSGADYITVHAEVSPHLHRTIYQIKELGVKAGVALNPATPFSQVKDVLGDLDLLLFMTVNPGFGGQKFIPRVLEKITECQNYLTEKGLNHLEIEVDGGVNAETAKLCRDAGVDILVAGSAIYNQKNRAEAIKLLRA